MKDFGTMPVAHVHGEVLANLGVEAHQESRGKRTFSVIRRDARLYPDRLLEIVIQAADHGIDFHWPKSDIPVIRSQYPAVAHLAGNTDSQVPPGDNIAAIAKKKCAAHTGDVIDIPAKVRTSSATPFAEAVQVCKIDAYFAVSIDIGGV